MGGWNYFSFGNDNIADAIGMSLLERGSIILEKKNDASIDDALDNMTFDNKLKFNYKRAKKHLEFSEENPFPGLVLVALKLKKKVPLEDINAAINLLEKRHEELPGINTLSWKDPLKRKEAIEQELKYLRKYIRE